MREFKLYNQKTIHFILGLITGLSFLSINFLISFFARFDQFNFSGFLICLVIPLSILFFSLGQKLKDRVLKVIFKIFILISLLVFPFYYFFTYYFLNHQALRNILLFLTSSLLFSGLGGLNQKLDSTQNFQINNYLYLGKLFGIVASILLVPLIGYIYIFYISLFIFIFFFFSFKKTTLLIFLSILYFINAKGLNTIDLISFNNYNQARQEQNLSNSASNTFDLNNTEKPQFFWNLRGLYTLIADQNHIQNWTHNFVLEFKQQYTNLPLNIRQLIYQRVDSETPALILGAGGGASLYYFKNLNKNIHLVDRDCTALDIFKKTNEKLDKVEIHCLDAAHIQNKFLNKKFELISLESSVSQSLKTQLPFLSPFNLLTLETLDSFKNMLIKNGIFMFEMNLVNTPQRKIIFEAALFNLNKVYHNQCFTLDEEYSKNHYIGYILCSPNQAYLDNFLQSFNKLNLKNTLQEYQQVNLNLDNNTPFLYVNDFLIKCFGQQYPSQFFTLIFILFIVFAFLLCIKKEYNMNSFLILTEGASTIQFYSLIYLVGSFFKNEIYSYILVSILSYGIYYLVIKNFKSATKKTSRLKTFIYTYVFLIIAILWLSQSYTIDSSLKLFLILLSLIILLTLNANIFSATVELNLSKQKNSNITINNSYVASVLIALTAIFLTGITFTFILSSLAMFAIGTALYKRANNL